MLYAVQAAYSSDFDRALSQVIFFYVPFALLFALLVRVDVDAAARRPLPRRAARRSRSRSSAIGFVEYAKRELLLNPKVIASNQFETYFRVNSLFFDPNIYGRFLATVMLGARRRVLLWSRRTRVVAGCACALALLWAGLVLTLSQSSFTALLAGPRGARRAALGRAAARRRSWRRSRPRPRSSCSRRRARSASTSRPTHVTSGRSTLVKGGVELARRPAGRRAGARARSGASTAARRRRRARARRRRRTRSRSRSPPSRASAGSRSTSRCSSSRSAACCAARARSIARAAVAAAFVALVVHTLLYAAFLEDPLAWALLAVGAALRPARGGALGRASGAARAAPPP